MRAALVRHGLDPSALLREVASEASGATVLFVGTVRELNEGRSVTGIDYSAYEAMALGELSAIASEAGDRFGTDHVVVEHRLGTLDLGEASVAIAVSHPHRAPAIDAARFVIEEIKKRVPIWKREHYADGTREWVDPTAASRQASGAKRAPAGDRGPDGCVHPPRGGPPPGSESAASRPAQPHHSPASVTDGTRTTSSDETRDRSLVEGR